MLIQMKFYNNRSHALWLMT